MAGSKRSRRQPTTLKAVERTAQPSDRTAFKWWGAAIIVAAGVLTYWNSLSVPFVLDDLASIVDNRQIREWWNLGKALSPPDNLAVAGRPLVNLSLAINYAVGGVEVRGYHIANLAIHLACALLLFGIVRRTLQGSPKIGPAQTGHHVNQTADRIAFATALIWTVHPLNSELIDYVVQRTESMMALFYLLTLYGSIRAHRSGRPGWWQAIAVGSCLLGMACKESMATAPLVVLLYDRVFEFDSFKRAIAERWRFYGGLAASWIVVLMLSLRGPRAEVVGLSSGVNPWTYLLNQTEMITRYLMLSVWPRSLVAFYGWPQPLSLADVAPHLAVVLVLLALAILALVRYPVLGFLGVWFFITLAPASSVIPVATEVGAERRMYLPLMALVLLAVIAVYELWSTVAARSNRQAASPLQPVVAWAAIAVTAGLLAVRTVERNREYASSLSLARTIVERRPTSVAHHILAQELILAGQHDEAIRELRAAAPGDSKARYPLGLELLSQDKTDEGINELQAFVRTWRLPYRLVPHWLEPSTQEVIGARNALAQAFARLERWQEVMEQARAVLTIAPSNTEAIGRLADALFAEEKYPEAAEYYDKYSKLRPGEVRALTRLGTALMVSQRSAEALDAFRRAVQVDPRDGLAQRNLGTALFDMRDAAGAYPHAREAVNLIPNDSNAHDLLGRTLAVQGRFAEAIAEFERALQIDPNNADAREDLARISRLR